MTLYSPPLTLNKQSDAHSSPQIEDAINGFTYSYFYTGNRLGNNNIDLEVSTLIMDSNENQFLRSCLYSGQKDTWKEVIIEQIKKHLKDIGVEEGFVKSETRYLDISPDNYLSVEKYQIKLLDIISKIRGNENYSL